MSVESKIKEIIAEQLAVELDSITRESGLQRDLGADSLDSVEIVLAIEENFSIEVTDENAERMNSVGDLIDHVESLLNG